MYNPKKVQESEKQLEFFAFIKKIRFQIFSIYEKVGCLVRVKMNILARKYFQSASNFDEVRFVSEEKDLTWEEVQTIASDLPRSWFELSRISPRDRIEFSRDYWLSQLPYHPKVHPILSEFFDRLDDIAVILRKEKPEDIFSAELVYSFADESTFFRGLPSPTEREINELKKEIGALVPRDYLAFVHIHNGFGKLSELGLLKIDEIPDARRRVMELILKASKPIKAGKSVADAGSLIPFFEHLGLSSFQCFYSDWYPGSEMGNVYLSGIDYTISDVAKWEESLAFPTFLEWLASFLQGINVS